MTVDYNTMDCLVRNSIEDLVDYNVKDINKDTLLEDIGLVSLDYVTIRVQIQKELDYEIDLDKLSDLNLKNYGDFINFLICN